jgi:hypothetical protein
MITPEQLNEWADSADDGEDVSLDGETLRELSALVYERNVLAGDE